MPNTYVVFNPVAGAEDPDGLYAAIASHLAAEPGSYEIYRTTGNERMLKVVRQALQRGFNLLIAAGGDGTVSAVASGLADTGIPLAILPTGTGNVLARELRIPLALDAALDLITGAHAIRSIDTMRVGEQHYLLNVSSGLSSLTMRDTGREEKRTLGPWWPMRGLACRSCSDFNPSASS